MAHFSVFVAPARDPRVHSNCGSETLSERKIACGLGIARCISLIGALLSQTFSGCSDNAQSSTEAKLAVIVPRPGPQEIEVSHDFGVVKAGSTVSHTFEIRNSTDTQWSIQQIVPSCACAIARVSSQRVNPGDHLEVQVTLNAGQKVMDTERKVDINLDSPRVPNIRLLLKAKVRADLTVWPTTLEFGMAPEGRTDPVSTAVLVSNYSSDNFAGLLVEGKPEWLEVEISPIESTPSRGGAVLPKQQWELVCTASPRSLKAGSHRNELKIKSADGAYAAGVVIAFEIQPRVLVVPEVVSITGMSATETVERTVLVRLLKPAPAAAPQVSVLDAAGTLLGVNATVGQVSATMWKVVLHVTAPPVSSQSSLKRTVLVTVPDTDDPPQRIDIMATLAP